MEKENTKKIKITLTRSSIARPGKHKSGLAGLGLKKLNKAVERPVVVNGAIVVRRIMNLSSSFDHRFVDGYDAAAMIQSLKDDPQFTKILEDPEIMNAVSSGDTAALMANPKFLQLLHNPTVRDIQQKVAQ